MHTLQFVAARGALVGPVCFLLAIVLTALLQQDYSHFGQMVSELGAVGRPYAAIMNYLGFLPLGLFIMGFSVVLAGWLKQRGISPAAAWLVMIHGAGMALATWLSCDNAFRCNPVEPSWMQQGHNLLAAIKFPLLIVAMFILGGQFIRHKIDVPFGIFSILAGFGAVLLMGLFVSVVETPSAPAGVYQRGLLLMFYLWLAALNLKLLASKPQV